MRKFSSAFYYNILTKIFFIFLILLSLIIVFFFIIELVFFTSLNYPNINSKHDAIHFSSRYIYQNYTRNIIQYLPECAEYDDKLFYKLKSGNCVFTNKEFTTKYDVNSEGLRDDEISLVSPNVIVLGDSYAMGWGVDENETFASLLEQNLKLRVLNASISSYGTARQIELLNSLDVSNLEYLIIQYCKNDFNENKTYLNNKASLPVSSKEEYNELVYSHLNRKQYSPFLFSKEFFLNLYPAYKYLNEWKQEEFENHKYKHLEEARLFLEVFKSANINKDVKIILFENDYRLKDDWFILSLRELIKTEYSQLNEFKFISTKDLPNDNYFLLDDHLNKDGHYQIFSKIHDVFKTNKSDVIYKYNFINSKKILKIKDYGPKEIISGQPFNQQNDGSSALWLVGENFTRYSQIYINGLPMETFVKEDTATAIVPKSFTDTPQILQILIKNINSESEEIQIEVK